MCFWLQGCSFWKVEYSVEDVAQVLLSNFLSAPQGESAPPCAVCERLQRRNNGAVPIERSPAGCAIEATICHIQKYIPIAATL